MLQYPSIPTFNQKDFQQHLGKKSVSFVKYDGSNLRWEWSSKQKRWQKFGTRHHLFDESTPLFSQAIPLFMEISDDILSRTIKFFGKPERITIFTEFFGESSFAGSHDESEKKQLRLIDVSMFKKGFLNHHQFIDVYGDASYCAEIMYEEPLSVDLSNKISNRTSGEGAIVRGDKFICKMKTQAWYDAVKAKYTKDWEKYV